VSDDDDARRRVEAFVADFHERWSRAGQPMRDPYDVSGFHVALAHWRSEVAALEAAHGAPGWRSNFDQSLSWPAEHNPADHLRWRALGPDDAVLVDRNSLGSFVTRGRSSSTWTPDVPLLDGSVLEVTEHLGYRHV
jgi:hypothetical protein